MPDEPRFAPASSFALDTLAEIFTRSFEAYFYPGAITAALLAAHVRIESLDLHRSLVMLVGDQPAGIALLALRGERAWCGGFGVTLPLRGRGLAHPLAAALIDQARQAGARSLSLEVLTRNERAIKTYLRAGFQARRDLRIFEWRRPDDGSGTGGRGLADTEIGGQGDSGRRLSTSPTHPLALSELAPATLLEHFAALHPAPAAWQRDLPALLVRGSARGLALVEGRIRLPMRCCAKIARAAPASWISARATPRRPRRCSDCFSSATHSSPA
jgi:GNAT superfamily N-acetyltransferase